MPESYYVIRDENKNLHAVTSKDLERLATEQDLQEFAYVDQYRFSAAKGYHTPLPTEIEREGVTLTYLAWMYGTTKTKVDEFLQTYPSRVRIRVLDNQRLSEMKEVPPYIITSKKDVRKQESVRRRFAEFDHTAFGIFTVLIIVVVSAVVVIVRTT